MEGILSTDWISFFRISSPLNWGLVLNSNAIAPETTGAAMDVPLKYPYLPSGKVLYIAKPGAKISTELAPTLVKGEIRSL